MYTASSLRCTISALLEDEGRGCSPGHLDHLLDKLAKDRALLDWLDEHCEVLGCRNRDASSSATQRMNTKNNIDHAMDDIANKFLGWTLPKSVRADGCATDPSYPHPRCGTNLLNYPEAVAMAQEVVRPVVERLVDDETGVLFKYLNRLHELAGCAPGIALDTQVANMRAALIRCHERLLLDIRAKTLNESAADGTQALSHEVATVLDGKPR